MDEMHARRGGIAGTLVGHRVDHGSRRLVAGKNADAPPFGKGRRPHAQVPAVEEKVPGLDHDAALVKMPGRLAGPRPYRSSIGTREGMIWVNRAAKSGLRAARL